MNSDTCVKFNYSVFLLIMGFIIWLFCMSGNLWLYTKYFEIYFEFILNFTLLVYECFYIAVKDAVWFWDTVTLFWNNLILLNITFKIYSAEPKQRLVWS